MSHSSSSTLPASDRAPVSFPTASSQAVSSSPTAPLPPQLPLAIEQWSSRALAAWLGVSSSTVKYHARQVYRRHSGRWEFNREQAQRVVNHIFQFGQVQTLRNKARQPAPSLASSPPPLLPEG